MLFCNSSWLGSTTATRRQRSVDMSGVTCLSYRHCSFHRPARLLIAWMLQRDAHEFSSLFCFVFFLLLLAGFEAQAPLGQSGRDGADYPPTSLQPKILRMKGKHGGVLLASSWGSTSCSSAWQRRDFFRRGCLCCFRSGQFHLFAVKARYPAEKSRESFFSNSLRMGFDSIVCSPLLLQLMFAPSCANRCCVDLSDDERR